MPYVNPGQLFVQTHGVPSGEPDVLRYAAYLRAESGLSDEPPIDLTRIYRRFEIPTPRLADLPGQQGLLLNPEVGLIIINENDMRTRQRFTEAHELLELLFSQLPGGGSWAARSTGPFRVSAKEALCNRGAAELLMPTSSLMPRVRRRGVSLQTAHRLAVEYEVSVTAALLNMAREGPGEHAVVLWRLKNKPSEIRGKSSDAQISLDGGRGGPMPPKRLRVEWGVGRKGGPWIPKHKSVPEGSSIYRSWESGEEYAGEDHLELGELAGRFRCENYPGEVQGERVVVSLLHLPGDSGCGPDGS